MVVTTFFASGFFLETWARARGVNPDRLQALSEAVRKLNHVGCGVMLALLPALGASPLPGVVIGASVLCFLFIASRRARDGGHFHFLFKRAGAVSYALGLVVTSIFAGGHALAFTAAYLVLAFGDPCAHAVGKRFPLWGLGDKSLGGFLAHAAVAAGVLAALAAIADAPISPSTVVIVALATSAAELFTRGGWDNLTIPLTAAGLLLVA
jgi:dolichol kinase